MMNLTRIGSAPAVMNIVSGRIAQPNSNSTICFDLIAQWLKDCLNNHTSSCPFEPLTSLPTRVLDIGLDITSQHIKVLETKGLEGVWVALSHCWGLVSKFILETKSLSQMTQGIALSALPKTFLDAVVVTRKLGFRYLWIDSLCILQDSVSDWEYESRRMQKYYSKSVLTIASDLASGDHESFLDNIRAPILWIKVPFVEQMATGSSHVYFLKEAGPQGNDSDQTPLNVRGWTLQEDVLSPRTLHYTSRELVLECQRCKYAETDVTPQGYTDTDPVTSIKRFFLRPESSHEDTLLQKFPHLEVYYQPIQRWYRLFENYCTRLLTFESDRLAAIAGLATELQRQTKFSYEAGIWKEDVHNGLLWAINGRGKRPEKYRAPSWSWASIDINFYWGINVNPAFQLYIQDLWDREDKDDDHLVEVLDCEIKTVNGDPFGEVVDGQLKVHGYMLPLQEWQGKSSPYINTFWRPIIHHKSHSTTGGIRGPTAPDQLVLDFDVSPEDNELSISSDGDALDINSEEEEDSATSDVALDDYPSDAILLRIKRIITSRKQGHSQAVFLCLLLVLQSQGGSQEYRRVGIAEVPDINGLGRDGWSQRVITIY